MSDEVKQSLKRLAGWCEAVTDGDDPYRENEERLWDNDLFEGDVKAVMKAAESLAAFKAYVHARLDAAGIPGDPESVHRSQGCRVGGRLDVVFAEIEHLRATVSGMADRVAEQSELLSRKAEVKVKPVVKPDDSALAELLMKCPVAGSVWRHRNGSLYVVSGAVLIESSCDPAVVYRKQGGNSFVKWCRPFAEFMDGRFKHEAELSEVD